MKIISLNINDFGGIQNHLMNYRKVNGNGKKVIDWSEWKKIDKSDVLNGLIEFVNKQEPTILILQEFEQNNSEESFKFVQKMNEMGYTLVGRIPKFKVSMTVMFIKTDFPYELIESPHKRYARSCSIKTGEFIIYGTHVPPKYDATYWEELIGFYTRWKEKKVILIGDFNTFKEDTNNKKKYNELINEGGVDVWMELGNPNETPTEKKYGGRLDYVIVSSQSFDNVQSMNIDSEIMRDGISDHAALILEIR